MGYDNVVDFQFRQLDIYGVRILFAHHRIDHFRSLPGKKGKPKQYVSSWNFRRFVVCVTSYEDDWWSHCWRWDALLPVKPIRWYHPVQQTLLIDRCSILSIWAYRANCAVRNSPQYPRLLSNYIVLWYYEHHGQSYNCQLQLHIPAEDRSFVVSMLSVGTLMQANTGMASVCISLWL